HGDGRLVDADGRTVLDAAAVHIELGRPVDGVDRLAVSARLQDGSLLVDLDELVAAGREHTAVATAHLPLAALGRLPEAGAIVEALPVTTLADGPLAIRFDLPSLDTETWSRWLAVDPPGWRARGAMAGALTIDPDAPTRMIGRLTAREVEIESGDTTARAAGPLQLGLAEGAIGLDRSAWSVGEQQIEVEGGAQWTPGWTFEDPPAALVESVELTADGTVPASIAVPFLAGGTTEGVLHLDAVISGSPSQLDADVRVDGQEAAFTWLTPYFTRFEAPRAEVRLADGQLHVDRFTARWNDGEIELDGTVGGLDQIDLQGYYDRVRYRLDYGLSVLVSGNMGYRARPSEPAELSANVLVDRGSLRRDLAAGREVLDQLLAPPELELPPIADEIAATRLAMQIATVDGIRVKNNLADVRVSWSPPLVVEGTLGAPRVFGEILAEPDGRLYAYGQVVRLDHAALRFSGDPRVGSTLDVEMTTSLEDPSIATPEDQQVLADLAQPDDRGSATAAEDQIADSLASGLTTYYGDQLASRLGQALGRTTVRYRPLWIFGESDPEARLVVSQDLSKHFSIGVAFDLTDSEQEIYLLDIHDVPGLPRLSATVFTSADSEVGGTIQQRLLFGDDDARPEEVDGLLLDEVTWSCSTCPSLDVLPKRAMRHALDIERGDPIPEDVEFDSEIEVAEILRRDGWTAPVVRARLSADETGEEADLRIEITPGPRATFRFDGEPPPKRRRASIRDLYRGDITEPASLVEMRDQALRVWRSLGHPEPEVEITVRPLDPARPDGDREVLIDSRPGPTVELEAPRFEGVPEAVATALA
ncbi:MAG: translocation/assembly module TamB domain-containing protein, partial [Acidobacteriota bacterium]